MFIMSVGIQETFFVYPFFSNEIKGFEKMVVFSDEVETITFTQSPERMVLPYVKDKCKLLKKYAEELKHYLGINTTIFSLYDLNGNKVGEVETYKVGYWF
jgi:hypothetical protein